MRLVIELVIDLLLLAWISSSIPGGFTWSIAIPVVVYGIVQYTEGASRRK